MHTVQHFIAGRFTAGESNQSIPLENPATGQPIAKVCLADDADVDHAVRAAKAAFADWQSTPALERARVLFQFKTLVTEHAEALAACVTREHGKTLADAKGSVQRGIELVEHMCGIPVLLQGTFSESVSRGVDCRSVRQPLGVCVGITPFNFPVMVPIWMFASAIACGNTFILKPSEKDPSVTLQLAELMQSAGCPDGVLNVIQGDRHSVERLIRHADVQAVSCVGSTPVAKHIYETAVLAGKRAQAFGGAKNHAVVLPDADIAGAAGQITGAAFGSAGERCMAVSVVVAVGDETADRLIDAMQPHIEAIRVGAGDQADVDMGPLIDAAHLARVQKYIVSGVEAGAKLLHDGRGVCVQGYEGGYFLGPCLFDRVTLEMAIYQEEIFGPVLCIVRVKTYDDALALVNAHPYGNGSAIFTRDGGAAQHFARCVQTGMVGINVPIPVPVAYHIFGGWKQSVFGDAPLHAQESVRFYTRAKSITERWPEGHTGPLFDMPAGVSVSSAAPA